MEHIIVKNEQKQAEHVGGIPNFESKEELIYTTTSIYTLPPNIYHTPRSVWSKTTLITAS